MTHLPPVPTDLADPQAALLRAYPRSSPNPPRSGVRGRPQARVRGREQRESRAGEGCPQDTGDSSGGYARRRRTTHVRAQSYLWALAGVLSSPCSNTAPWHSSFPEARLRSPPTPLKRSRWGALARRARGAHRPSAPPWPSRTRRSRRAPLLCPARAAPSPWPVTLPGRRAARSQRPPGGALSVNHRTTPSTTPEPTRAAKG